MMRASFLALAALLALGAAQDPLCKMPTDAYPPKADTKLPWYTVDLATPAKERWADIVKPLGPQIHDMVYSVIDLLPKELGAAILAAIDGKEDAILDHFPSDYGDEIRGISEAINMDVGALILFNVAYELEGACTSMVVQDKEGTMYHARNLDFGLFLGWDKRNFTWGLAEKLRPLLFNAKIVNGSDLLYQGTYFAGYVGALTAVKPGAFSISVDTRYDSNLDRGLLEWFRGNYSGHFVSFTTRQTLETAADFDAALHMLTTTDMVGPSYMILGGAKTGQGAIITREEAKSLHLWTLENDLHNTSFYVIETNYDHWEDPPFIDDRRYPAMKCLEGVGQENINFGSLFNILSGEPNLNMLTTYTTLIKIETGELEAYTQDCKFPCSPW